MAVCMCVCACVCVCVYCGMTSQEGLSPFLSFRDAKCTRQVKDATRGQCVIAASTASKERANSREKSRWLRRPVDWKDNTMAGRGRGKGGVSLLDAAMASMDGDGPPMGTHTTPTHPQAQRHFPTCTHTHTHARAHTHAPTHVVHITR